MERINEAVKYIQENTDSFNPLYGIILGTGLGQLAKEIDEKYSLDYGNIPHFPVSTVESHQGRLIFGYLEGKPVVAMQGRFHYYEGYSLKEVTFPVRVMKMLGIKRLFVSNAAGGLNPKMEVGDLMIIKDHINLLPDNPLRGPNLDELGPRFPDMSQVYDPEAIAMAEAFARENNIRCHTGVYVAVPGPNLETKAEYKFLRLIGADAVGMSTVPEVIVARHMNLPVFGISAITDIGFPIERVKEVSLEDVIAAASTAEPHMTKIIRALVANLDN
ncbi:MAG: purine-nucleoside phosphorylase [Chlorobi bacterium]|nr:purine-nucleoside phosphorylase [Chlorobiota bacterium]